MLIYYLQMLDTPEEKIRFEEIYLKYRGLMYHVADGVLHNREDAVRNAFLRIIKHFNPVLSISAGYGKLFLAANTQNGGGGHGIGMEAGTAIGPYRRGTGWSVPGRGAGAVRRIGGTSR